MKKILHYFQVEEYRRDMSKDEKTHRDNKLAMLLLLVLAMTIFAMVPLYAESVPKSNKFEYNEEWKCPNRACGYDNYDGIRYCGLCGTERGSRPR